jgi:RNA polymerase sigma factor (sigma-70 family)
MPTADERWNDDILTALARDEPFLRQLARHLVRDPGTADDLVQETWLHAFSLRPTVGESLYGWTATVLRRLAARRRHSEARRAVREAAAARSERLDDPLDAVQHRLDAQAVLVTALRSLSSEQREALVLRYAEERSLADIAARQGTSVANVKARLARGLGVLRADLDRRAGGERGAHGVLLAPLLAPAVRRGHWLKTGAPSTTLAGGVLLMSNTLKLSFVVVALLAFFGIALWLAVVPPRPTESAIAERDGADLAHDEEQDVVGAQAVGIPARSSGPTVTTEEPNEGGAPFTAPVHEVAAVPLGCLRVEVERQGAPLSGATVLVSRGRSGFLDFRAELPPRTTRHVLDAEGAALICGLEHENVHAPLTVALELDDRVSVQRVLQPSEYRGGVLVEIVLGGATIYGRVSDFERGPAAGAILTVRRGGRGNASFVMTHAGDDGTYSITGLGAGEYHVGATITPRGSWPDDDDEFVVLRDQERRQVDLGPDESWFHWRGRVLTLDGDPIRSTTDRVGSLLMTPVSFRGSTRYVWFDDEGRFEVEAEAGRYKLHAIFPGRTTAIPVDSDFELPAHDVELDIALPGTRLTGSIANWREPSDPGPVRPRVYAHEVSNKLGTSIEMPIQVDGTFVIDGLGPGVWCIRTGTSPTAPETRIEVTAENRSLEVTLPGRD